MFLKLGEARGTSCYQLLVSPNFLSFMRSEVCTNVQLPDQKILWFRNSPPIESDKRHEEAQKSAEKELDIELFIEPLKM